MDYPKTYEVFVYPKTFKLRNAVGEPPRWMFSCEMDKACGRQKYWIKGKDKEDVEEYVRSCLDESINCFFIGNEIKVEEDD